MKFPADGILRVRDRQVECDAGEREIRKVLRDEEMAELIVRIENDDHSEIGLVAEYATDREARCRGVVQRCGAAAAVEASRTAELQKDLGFAFSHQQRHFSGSGLFDEDSITRSVDILRSLGEKPLLSSKLTSVELSASHFAEKVASLGIGRAFGSHNPLLETVGVLNRQFAGRNQFDFDEIYASSAVAGALTFARLPEFDESFLARLKARLQELEDDIDAEQVTAEIRDELSKQTASAGRSWMVYLSSPHFLTAVLVMLIPLFWQKYFGDRQATEQRKATEEQTREQAKKIDALIAAVRDGLAALQNSKPLDTGGTFVCY